jgi:ABC-type dipeptide/oligopeptide/nickel transport system permease subunit
MFYRRKKTYHSSSSLSALAWKRYRKNSLGMIALGWILFSILISILGYTITPDATPFANNQHLELATKKPGFEVDFAQIPLNNPISTSSFFHKMLFGQPLRYTEIPIYAHTQKGDKIILEHYTGMTPNDGQLQEVDADKVKIVHKKFYLGSDRFGRDLYSQLLIGSRVSLSVGFIAVMISLLIGITLGLISGYFGGRTDQLIMWFINVVWSIPTLLLVIAITMALGRGFWQVFIAVGLTMWVEVARVVRGQVMSIRNKEFVEAGVALGYSKARILFKHILPNVLSPLIVISAANFASAILIEAGLSFLGIGVQPPIPSWGTMIKEHYGYIILDKAYLAILPGAAIMLMVLAFMVMGNSLRDALDVKVVKE